MRIKITALALAVLLPFTAAQAADNLQANKGRWQHNNQNWTQELKLNESQQQQFQHRRDAYRTEQQKQRESYREQQQRQHAAFQKKQQAQRDRHHADLRTLLTPEQRLQFDRKIEANQARSHSPRGAKHSAMYKQDMRGHKRSMHGKPMRDGRHHPAPRNSRPLR